MVKRIFPMWKRYTVSMELGTAKLSQDGKSRYSVEDAVTLRSAKRGEDWLVHLREEDAQRHADELNAEDAKRRAAGEGPWFVPVQELRGNWGVTDTRTNKAAIGKDGKPLENMPYKHAATLAEEMSNELARGPRYQPRIQESMKIIGAMGERQYAVWDVYANKIAVAKDGGRLVTLLFEEAKQLAEEMNSESQT